MELYMQVWWSCQILMVCPKPRWFETPKSDGPCGWPLDLNMTTGLKHDYCSLAWPSDLGVLQIYQLFIRKTSQMFFKRNHILLRLQDSVIL